MVLVVELHQSHNLDSGIVVTSILEKVSVTHDQGAIENIIVSVVLVEDVLDVVDGVGLTGRSVMNVGLCRVQVLEHLSKARLSAVRFLVMMFLLNLNKVLKMHFAPRVTESHSDASESTISRVAKVC